MICLMLALVRGGGALAATGDGLLNDHGALTVMSQPDGLSIEAGESVLVDVSYEQIAQYNIGAEANIQIGACAEVFTSAVQASASILGASIELEVRNGCSVVRGGTQERTVTLALSAPLDYDGEPFTVQLRLQLDDLESATCSEGALSASRGLADSSVLLLQLGFNGADAPHDGVGVKTSTKGEIGPEHTSTCYMEDPCIPILHNTDWGCFEESPNGCFLTVNPPPTSLCGQCIEVLGPEAPVQPVEYGEGVFPQECATPCEAGLVSPLGDECSCPTGSVLLAPSLPGSHPVRDPNTAMCEDLCPDGEPRDQDGNCPDCPQRITWRLPDPSGLGTQPVPPPTLTRSSFCGSPLRARFVNGKGRLIEADGDFFPICPLENPDLTEWGERAPKLEFFGDEDPACTYKIKADWTGGGDSNHTFNLKIRPRKGETPDGPVVFDKFKFTGALQGGPGASRPRARVTLVEDRRGEILHTTEKMDVCMIPSGIEDTDFILESEGGIRFNTVLTPLDVSFAGRRVQEHVEVSTNPEISTCRRSVRRKVRDILLSIEDVDDRYPVGADCSSIGLPGALAERYCPGPTMTEAFRRLLVAHAATQAINFKDCFTSVSDSEDADWLAIAEGNGIPGGDFVGAVGREEDADGNGAILKTDICLQAARLMAVEAGGSCTMGVTQSLRISCDNAKVDSTGKNKSAVFAQQGILQTYDSAGLTINYGTRAPVTLGVSNGFEGYAARYPIRAFWGPRATP